MNDLMRPAMYEAWMAIEPCRPRDGPSRATWDVVGPVCESGDWLGRDRALAVQPGDVLAVLSAGAYGMADGQQLQHPAARRRGDGRRRRAVHLIREREPAHARTSASHTAAPRP
jgi:diaminopimelate decarboxylase